MRTFFWRKHLIKWRASITPTRWNTTYTWYIIGHINSHIIASKQTTGLDARRADIVRNICYILYLVKFKYTPAVRSNILYAYITADAIHASLGQETYKSEIESQPTMCQVHTGAYVSLLAPGKPTIYTACYPGKTITYILHCSCKGSRRPISLVRTPNP